MTMDTRHFNPRSREGSDDTRTVVDPEQKDFNPRSREGSDLFLLDLTV